MRSVRSGQSVQTESQGTDVCADAVVTQYHMTHVYTHVYREDVTRATLGVTFAEQKMENWLKVALHKKRFEVWGTQKFVEGSVSYEQYSRLNSAASQERNRSDK